MEPLELYLFIYQSEITVQAYIQQWVPDMMEVGNRITIYKEHKRHLQINLVTKPLSDTSYMCSHLGSIRLISGPHDPILEIHT